MVDYGCLTLVDVDVVDVVWLGYFTHRDSKSSIFDCIGVCKRRFSKKRSFYVDE